MDTKRDDERMRGSGRNADVIFSMRENLDGAASAERLRGKEVGPLIAGWVIRPNRKAAVSGSFEAATSFVMTFSTAGGWRIFVSGSAVEASAGAAALIAR
jgi:hypothetical protein